MRARIVKREDDKVVLMTDQNKLIRASKDRFDFDYELGDYVTIETCENEVFILPCRDNAQIDTAALTETKKSSRTTKNFSPDDPVVRKAVEISIAKGRFSTAMLQTYLGKNHAYVSGLASWFDEIGVIGPQNGNRPRTVLISSLDEFDAKASGRNVGNVEAESTMTTSPDVAPTWIMNIKEKDKNFTKTIVWTSIIAVLLVLSMSSSFSKYGTPKSDTMTGFLVIMAVVLAIMIRAIILKCKISSYFRSDGFQKLKQKISKNAKDINELNRHIEDLKGTTAIDRQVDQGESVLTSGGYNFKRPGWRLLQDKQNVHHCGLQVVKNSKVQPFKYVCKYFDLKPDEDTLNDVEEVFNNFSAAEQGKESLIAERNDIIAGIDGQIPKFVKKHAPNRFLAELGFEKIDLNTAYFPTYSFRYVSPGGNSTADNTIVMDLDNLERFINYIGKQIKWRKSVAGQRALMTTALRESIKKRDHYTCKKCGASVAKEPHLLLEIDHITPLAKGGLTTEKNLQTLCWRCNRTKGAKIE